MSPTRASWYRPGSSLRRARSPVAPKITITWSAGRAGTRCPAAALAGPKTAILLSAPCGVVELDVAAELLTHRREQLVREDGLAAGAEALEERGAQHGRRHPLV